MDMNFNLFSKKALTAAMAAVGVSFFVSGGQPPVIHGNIVGPAAWVDYVSGIYRFSAEAPLSLEMQKESRFINVNGGGDNMDGMYHYIGDNDGLGTQYDYRMYLYDAATWIPKNNYRVPDNWSATDFSYDRTTGRLYGCFTSDRSTWWFGWMDPADAVFHKIASAQGGYPVVAANPYGAVYAIDIEGNLLAVNKADGSTVKLFSTGLIPAGAQSGCFDMETGLLYWCFRDAADHTALYSIDITAAGAEGVTLIDRFPQDEVVTGIYIEPEAADPSRAPASVTDLKAEASAGKVAVSFTLPSVTADGSAIGAPYLGYVVLVDGMMPEKNAQGAPGTGVRLEYELADGEHMVTVIASNGIVAGAPVTEYFYVGADAPAEVSDLEAYRDGDTFVATWTAPSTGVHGGAINSDALSYEVKFFTGNRAETYTVAGTRFETTPDIDYPADCFAEVVAVDGTRRSESVSSLKVMMGPGYPLPYTADFEDGAATASGFLAVDANGDGATWFYDPVFNDMRTDYKSGYGDMDDWLFTPIFRLDDGYFYHVQFDYTTAGNSYEELMEIKAGLLRSAEGMTVTVSPESVYASASASTRHEYFTIPASGNWHVGFHSVTRGSNLYLAIGNIKVERGGLMTAPAEVSDLKAVPAADGSLECLISFVAPSLTLDGDPVEENMRIEVRRAGRRLKELKDIAPGTPCDVTVAGRQGDNTYEVVCFNGDGNGMPAFVSAYVGEDKPLPPSNVRLTIDKTGCPLVSWDAPAGGVNGGVVIPGGVTYSVRRSFDKQYLLENSREHSVVDRLGLDVVDQALMYYQVYATNAAGTSVPAESEHFTMGKPYGLPYFESFKDMQEMKGPWLGMLLDNQKGAWYVDEEGYRPSCEPYDGNGGLVTFAPPEAGHTSRIATPLICIDDAEYPTLEFYFYATRDNDSRLTVGVRTAANDLEDLWSHKLSDAAFNPGWNLVRIPLVDYQGEEYVQVYFTGLAGEAYMNHIHLDCIGISDIPRYDVAASVLEVPDAMTPGTEAYFMATVTNTGIDPVKDIEVTLMRGDIPVCTRQVALIPGAGKVTVDLTDMPDLTFADLMEYSFAVSAPDDSNAANDRSRPYEVDVLLPCYPVPAVSGYMDGKEAVLEWTRPVTDDVRAYVTDGFESYAPFIIDNVGDWTLRDIDGGAGTTGILDGSGNPVEYENTGKPMAYQVFNPALVGFPLVDEDGERSMYAAHKGEQMMCAFCDLDAYNNDWLISPLLPGSEQQITFYAKSYTPYYGLEAFIVMVSSSGTATGDFRELTEVINAPADWTRYSFTLPEGTRHFAIRCVSVNMFALCVDDVKFIPASSAPIEMALTGYNVYRDGVLAKTVGADATGCRIPFDGDAGKLRFRVSAVYSVGESAHSDAVELGTSGIDGAASDSAAPAVRAYRGGISVEQPEGGTASVYTVDGRMVATVEGSGHVAVASGIYVVRMASSAVKVAVP